MTGHKFLPKIQFHPLFIVFGGIAVLAGAFVELITIVTIVIIHEFGHFTAARFFKWRIRRMYMWIFGAIMETDEHGVRPIHEECIVILAGPIQHLWIYGATWILQQYGLLPPAVIQGIFFYNTVILIFNILPIWPLDGGKLLYLVLTSLVPYQKGYERTLIISTISCIAIGFTVLLFTSFHIQLLFMLAFLLVEIWREWKRKQYVYMRFLFHRLHGQPYVKDDQLIYASPHTRIEQVFKQFRREKECFIYMKSGVNAFQSRYNPFHERICLDYYFYKDGITSTIDDVYESQFITPSARLQIK